MKKLMTLAALTCVLGMGTSALACPSSHHQAHKKACLEKGPEGSAAFKDCLKQETAACKKEAACKEAKDCDCHKKETHG